MDEVRFVKGILASVHCHEGELQYVNNITLTLNTVFTGLLIFSFGHIQPVRLTPSPQ